MRLNMLMFTIVIERTSRKNVDHSIQRARTIGKKINDVKSKYHI
ncbi:MULTISPECIES: hypothetical protein [Halobacillus]|nr:MULTISPECIES: hypothetical protein [Halobacillus]